MPKCAVIAAIAVLCTAATVLAEDLSPSGAVVTVTGPEVVAKGERVSGEITFAKRRRPHDVGIRWVDTKGRICEQITRNVTVTD